MQRAVHFAGVVDHRINDIRINDNTEVPHIVAALQAIVQGRFAIPSRTALLGRVEHVRELYVHSYRYAKSQSERSLFRSIVQQRIDDAIRRLEEVQANNSLVNRSLTFPLVAYITPHVEPETSVVYGLILPSAMQGVQSTSDRQAALEIVRKDPFALEHMPEEFRRDRGIVRAAVRKNGMALQFAHPDLRKDFAIVRLALRSNGMAYQFIDPYLKEYSSLARIAVRQNGWALKLLSEEMKNSWEIGCEAIQQNPMAFYLAGDILRKNPDFIALAHHEMKNMPPSPSWAASPYDA
jgi:hypothetical protein